MARIPRKRSKTGIYHIMLRGINKQTIFEDDEDRIKFLHTLTAYKEISNYIIYGYCLMDNHVHLLIRETDESISIALKRICSSYVYWYNLKYKRCGHLFQDRFRSEPVNYDSYFLTVLRYIHQNPLKAKVVRSVAESRWISFHEYVGKANLVDTDYGLSYFSKDRNKAISFFVQFMNKDNKDQCLEDVVRIRLTDDEVRRAIQQMGISNISELQKLDKRYRNEVLRRLKKKKGITIRQLARVTGISKSVIDRLGHGDR